MSSLEQHLQLHVPFIRLVQTILRGILVRNCLVSLPAHISHMSEGSF